MLDAELTVPGSLIFHFLNHSPISPTSRPVPISSETSPLGLLSLPDPSSRRSYETPAEAPRFPTPGNGSPSSRKSSDHAGDKAWDGTARVNWELQAIHRTPMAWTKQQRRESEGEEDQG